MTQHYLRTSAVAKAIGVHPNTVRLYEAWGFLPAAPRSPSGYRLFTEAHLDQMRLARIATHGGWPGRNIRGSALKADATKKPLQIGEAADLLGVTSETRGWTCDGFQVYCPP